MKFKPGDLVMIVANDASARPHYGKVGSVIGVCWTTSIMSAFNGRPPFYHLTCLEPDHVCREDALKKIDGERPTIEVDETRDEPVAA